MKIAVIGAGKVGGILGRRWAAKGHEVIFGVRDPGSRRVRELVAAAGANARAASVTEAAATASVVALAVPWSAAKSAISSAGDLGGKVLVDCTNPLRPALDGLEVGPDASAAEYIANWASGAKVVKAFNTIGSGNIADPVYDGEKIAMLMCGDDAGAKEIVGSLARQLDFDVVDVGGLEAARYLEALAMLWIHMAYKAELGPDFAFKIVRRPS